jgi:hypothetical protein
MDGAAATGVAGDCEASDNRGFLGRRDVAEPLGPVGGGFDAPICDAPCPFEAAGPFGAAGRYEFLGADGPGAF